MAGKRSPNCPAQSLNEAIENVGAIYAEEGRNSFPGTRAVIRMGYNGLNGASRRALGAVRGFGLLEGRGAELRVSDDAVLIIADAEAEDQSERQAALLRCLRHNRVFSDLYERYREQSSTQQISAYLQKKYRFKPTAADKTALVFRSSLNFVGTDLNGQGATADEYVAKAVAGGIKTVANAGGLPTGANPRPGSETGTARVLYQPQSGEFLTGFQGSPGHPQTANHSGSASSCDQQDSFVLEHGVAQLSWPAQMSCEEFEDFTDWLVLEHRKIARRVTGGRCFTLSRKAGRSAQEGQESPVDSPEN
ncbi:MAG: hypothetical protein R3F50_17680 [Gammaproteobacteria bacterium]|jgi:hypothetical protein